MRVWNWLARAAVTSTIVAGCLLTLAQVTGSADAEQRPKIEGPVAILPVVSWEHPYRVTGLPAERRTFQDTIDEVAQLIYYHYTWEREKRPREEPRALRPIWADVARTPAELIAAQGIELAPREKVDMAVREHLPEFWDADGRTPEKIAAFAESAGAQHVVMVELLPSRFSVRLTVADYLTYQMAAPVLAHDTVRVEVYDRAGRSESASGGYAVDKEANEREVWRNAIWQALTPWLGLPTDSWPPVWPGGSRPGAGGIQYGPEKLSRPDPVVVARGAKVGVTVFSTSPDRRGFNAQKLTDRLPGRLSDYLKKRGLSVVELPSPVAEETDAKSVGLASSLRTSARLVELGRARGVATAISADVLGAYYVQKKQSVAGPYYVVLATAVDVGTGKSAKLIAATEEYGRSIEEQVFGLLTLR